MARTIVESKTKTAIIGFDEPFCVIGERINPTGRKKLASELEAGDFTTVERDALAQVEAGANILDINANNNSVIHYGHLSGIKKRNIFSKSALFVNPGFIGLGLLDACAMGVPVLLSSAVNHSHEYEYFEDTAGFLISGKSANDFASSIIKISEDRLTLESKSFKAISLASKYTIENMAYRFKQKLFEI